MQCRHHPTCPGCPLLDHPYPEQLAHKRARLQAALDRYPHLALGEVPPVAPSPYEEAYRHRLKLPLHVGRQHVAVGLYDRASGRVLDTPDCPVLEPGLREALAAITSWLRGRRGVHSIDLRRSAATGELQLVLACEGGDLHGGRRGARQLLQQVDGLVSVAVSRADPQRKRVLGTRPKVLVGTDALEEAVGDTRYQILPGAFFQVDPRRAAWLHDQVRAMVGDARRVLDLYAGVGAYALMLAEGRDRVVAVEEVPQAAAAARAMAPPNVEVVTAKVESLPLSDPFDAAVINPARRGSDPATLAALAKATSRLVYVSCGPETLARDLDVLAAHGLRVAEIVPADLFPQTAEVETVVRLERGPALRAWPVPGGEAGGPWTHPTSGARGRPQRALVLVIGKTPASGPLPRGRFKLIGTVASHSLIRVEVQGPLVPALAALARSGHPVAGRDPRTRAFFADKAGLVRPFVHVEVAGQARAPLHGDLVQALIQLGASERLVARAGA